MRSFFYLFSLAFILTAQNSYTFLDRQAIGADIFTRAHPDHDGRGVIIMVIDSGVDMSVPGLRDTPRDTVKVIDVRDFSGEGDIPLDPAESGRENNEEFLQAPDGRRLYGHGSFLALSADSLFYIGFFEEKQFINPQFADLNGNGRRDDSYGLAVFLDSSDVWRAVVDLDGDGNLHDEKVLRDYAQSRRPLKFRSPGRRPAPFGVALKVDMDEEKAFFHFDAGGHGTHVAGIAAGHNIGHMEGFDGIAPGAQIISLKIGDERLSGAATTGNSMRRAYEFIDEYARTHPEQPIVATMSYGIGAEEEGASVMEYQINDLIESHNNVYVCLSAGNEGPGLSSIGLPSTAEHALTVGAVNTARNARDNFAAHITTDKIFAFSSRGGETAKPDVVAPGSALSTVPPYDGYGIKSGTSMATPQAAGAMALLLSASGKNQPDMFMLKRALRYSARAIKGYALPDQGYGMIQVPAAWKLLQQMLHKPDPLIRGYAIRTFNPGYSPGSTAGYWRSAGLFPTIRKPQSFFVSPVFADSVTPEQKQEAMRAFRLKSSAPWLKTVQKNIVLKQDNSAEISVYAEGLRKPGLYSARVEGYLSGGFFNASAARNRVFDFPLTVIIPHFAGRETDYRLRLTHSLDVGDVQRDFIRIPTGATSMALTLKPGDEQCRLSATLFDPAGHEIMGSLYLDGKRTTRAVKRLGGPQLEPGIYEITYYNAPGHTETARFSSTLAFGGLQSTPRVLRRFSLRDQDKPRATLKIVNRFSTVYRASIRGQLEGIQKKIRLRGHKGDYSQGFEITDRYKNVVFNLEMNKRDFNRLTDFVIRVKDINDRILVNTAMTNAKMEVVFTPESSGAYTLELLPAFSDDNQDQWSMDIKQSFNYFKTIRIESSRETFYPDVNKTIDIRLQKMPQMAPEGYYLYGAVWLDSREMDALRTTIPIEIRTRIE